jgi:hypothetical protein
MPKRGVGYANGTDQFELLKGVGIFEIGVPINIYPSAFFEFIFRYVAAMKQALPFVMLCFTG